MSGRAIVKHWHLVVIKCDTRRFLTNWKVLRLMIQDFLKVVLAVAIKGKVPTHTTIWIKTMGKCAKYYTF